MFVIIAIFVYYLDKNKKGSFINAVMHLVGEGVSIFVTKYDRAGRGVDGNMMSHLDRDSGNNSFCFSFLGYPKRNDFVPSHIQKKRWVVI